MSSIVRIIFFAFHSMACAPEYTPWDSKIPSEERENMNAKSLDRLSFTEFPFRMAMIADPQGHPYDLEETILLLNNYPQKIDFIAVAGDVTDYSLKHEYLTAEAALLKSRYPVLTAPGNHDGIAFGRGIFSQIFGATDFDFSYGPFHFVFWNNNQLEWGETDFDAFSDRLSQEKTIIISHIPPSADVHSEEQFERWKDIYREKKPLMSLHGHLHHDSMWTIENSFIMVTERNAGVRYSLFTFGKDSFSVENCTFARCTLDWKQDYDAN